MTDRHNFTSDIIISPMLCYSNGTDNKDAIDKCTLTVITMQDDSLAVT